MSRVLFAWELGANMGHVGQLAPIAARLEEEGHELLFAVKDMVAAQGVLRGLRARIVQAPVARGMTRREPAASYADMLGNVGYADTASIAALLRGWLDLFALFDPQAVVVDHAPTALLAARIAGLPRTDVAFGFLRPPRVQPLPSLQPWRKFPTGHLEQIEARVLGYVNTALRSYRAAPLARLADLFAIEASFLVTFEEIDQYEGRTGETYHGALLPEDMGIERDWPAGERPRIVAYLRSSPVLETALDVIVASGAAALCCIPDAAPALIERYAPQGIIISREPLKLKAALQGAHASLGYGGHGFVSASLLAGVPCVVIPNNIEQVLTARRVAQLGAGLATTRTRAGKELVGHLKLVLQEPRYRERAQAFAQRYASHQPVKVAARIAATVSRLAGTPVQMAARL